jgi:hypothetical protein
MTEQTVRKMRDASPFRPFRIHLADGRDLEVVHPDHLFFMPKRPEFIVVLPNGDFRIVDKDQVVSIGRGSSARASKH